MTQTQPVPINRDAPVAHPKGLYVLFMTEMWERFSYYGMRAIFALYMIKALAFDKALASNIYGSYTGLVYLTPLLGGYISDRYWGNRKSIIAGGDDGARSVHTFFQRLHARKHGNGKVADVFRIDFPHFRKRFFQTQHFHHGWSIISSA